MSNTSSPDATCRPMCTGALRHIAHRLRQWRFTVQGATVAVDSASHPAVSLTGNANIAAPSVGVVGTVSLSGNGKISNLKTGIACSDPLAGVSPPSIPRPNQIPSVSVSGNGSQTISPGVYQTISIAGNGRLTLNPGQYVILGQFSATGNGQVAGSGISLYLACSSYPTPCTPGTKGAALSLTGNGTFHLTGPPTGCLSLPIFSDRNKSSTISITGNGSDSLGGVVYAPSGAVVLSGNGSFVVPARMIVGTMTLTGNGNVTVNPPALIGCALTLAPNSASPQIGTTQQLTATLTSNSGAPISGQTVTFSITGANATSGSATTDTSGYPPIHLRGTTVGTDSATASLTEGTSVLRSNTSTITWVKAAPQMSTSPSKPAILMGASVTDTATLSGSYSPTGSVTWNVYAASDTTCKTPLNTSSLTASLSGISATSSPFTPGAPGMYQFVASYPGDANDQSAAGSCGDPNEQFMVSKAAPQISTSPTTSTFTVGASVTERQPRVGLLAHRIRHLERLLRQRHHLSHTAQHQPADGKSERHVGDLTAIHTKRTGHLPVRGHLPRRRQQPGRRWRLWRPQRTRRR